MGTKRINRRKLRASDVTFELEVSPEDTSPLGNVMASGDDSFDRDCEREILDSLESGNELAWCRLRMKATWVAPDGTTFEGVDSLGGCSFLSDGSHGGRKRQLDECVESHEMKTSALADLQREVNDHDHRKARDAVLDILDTIPDTTIRRWPEPLAKAVLAMRRIPK